MLELEQPNEHILWLSAVDPAQPWGKSLSHMVDRSFLNVPGTVVALRAGVPVAVFERQGKVLRTFKGDMLQDVIRVFVQDYARRRIYPMQNRLIVKDYPQEAVDALSGVGFSRELQDYALYQGVIK
jgi:ATP-dependent Lhr-like helicase